MPCHVEPNPLRTVTHRSLYFPILKWHYEIATIEAHAAGKAEGYNTTGYVCLYMFA